MIFKEVLETLFQAFLVENKTSLSAYIICSFENLEANLDKLGKHKTRKDYLYIKNLADVNM